MIPVGVLTAAYGRKYNTAAEVQKDYYDGKDFIFHNPSSQWNGKYCSQRDFDDRAVELRFGKNDNHVIIVGGGE